MSNQNIVTIEPYRSEELEGKIAKLNRRAAKLGLEPVTYTKAERIIRVPVIKYDDYGCAYPTGHSREVLVIDYTIEGVAPVVNGYELICRLEHTEAGNIVTRPIGTEEDCSPWFTCGPKCEHCNTDRNRKATFILRRTETRETIQVGHNCLADYLRTENATAVLEASLWGDFFPPNDEEGAGGFYRRTYSTRQMLAFAVAAIRVGGGYRKGRGGTRSTVEFARGMRPTGMENIKAAEAWDAAQPTEVDFARADLVREWGKVQTGGDYMHNIATACTLDYSIARAEGILISAPQAYARAMGEIEAKSKTEQLQKIMPKVGRYEITGVVRSVKLHESAEGFETLKMLVAVVENEGTWNAWVTVPSGLSYGDNKASEGDTVTLTATVQPKEEGFAILKRPTKASRTAKAA